jgi:hypothetical protein
MSLKQYIQQQNTINAMFATAQRPAVVLPTDSDLLLPRHINELAEQLSSSLSPEALTCDGELRGAKLRAKAKMLNAAKAELEALGATVPAY